MSKSCWKIVDWVICGEGEANKWELGGKNVEFYPDISHKFSVTQRVWSTAFSYKFLYIWISLLQVRNQRTCEVSIDVTTKHENNEWTPSFWIGRTIILGSFIMPFTSCPCRCFDQFWSKIVLPIHVSSESVHGFLSLKLRPGDYQPFEIKGMTKDPTPINKTTMTSGP